MPHRSADPPRGPRGPDSSPDIDAVLGDSTALWEAVQRASGDVIVVVDRQQRMRFVNRTSHGLTPEQVVGHSILDFTVDGSASRLGDAIAEVFRTGTTATLDTIVRPDDGATLEFAVRLGPVVRDGSVAAVIACCEDITALRRIERDLRRERQVLRRLIDIQEQERQLVSYEIHDGLAQYLAGAIMHVEAHLHALDGREPRELVDGLRLLRAATEESRRLIGGLRPPALDELGIADAIESLVADARIEIPCVTFRHDLPEERLPASLETTIFRIVQESLTNARRHADARSASVVVEQVTGGVHIVVTDDGRGFDPSRVADNRFGLEGIRQRCRLAGAEPTIASSPGRGTSIDVTLPRDTPVG